MRRPTTQSAGFLITAMAIAAASVGHGGAQVTGGEPSPVQIANQRERERMMVLLKIPAIPPGAVSSNPATYDESTANPYPELPDPLTLKNGETVTSASMWRSHRRAELMEDFEREVYGRRPRALPGIRWEIVDTAGDRNGDVAVTTKRLLGRVDNSGHPQISVNIQATLTTPAGASGPVPVIVQIGGGGFAMPEGVPALSNPCIPPGAAGRGAAGGRGAGPAAVPGGAQGPPPTSFGWQHQVLARGWGYANLNPGSVQADCGAGLTSGIIGLVNGGQPRALDDWGALSAWAWGASRLLDYFATDAAVDEERVGIQGHSRYGKAALVAMAFDERFAVAYISSSGHGGAKLHRRRYGETVENVVNSFYHWMAGNYLKYAGRWDSLPVDSHELIALCAPRPVFLSAGSGPGPRNADGTVPVNDAWVDPKGSFLAAVGAGPVYRLLGGTGLGTTAFPEIDTPVISGDLGFHQHPAGHTAEPTWPTFLRFAERYLRRPAA